MGAGGGMRFNVTAPKLDSRSTCMNVCCHGVCCSTEMMSHMKVACVCTASGYKASAVFSF